MTIVIIYCQTITDGPSGAMVPRCWKSQKGAEVTKNLKKNKSPKN